MSHQHHAQSNPEDPHPLFLIMTGLLYPGILATFIYEFLTPLKPLKWATAWDYLATPQSILTLILFVHYAFDYAYTATERSKSGYGRGPFILDCLILTFMALALVSAEEKPPELLGVCVYMLLTKVTAFVWEGLEQPKGGRVIEILSDATPAILYLVALVLIPWETSMAYGYTALIIIITIDALLYIFHDRVRKKLKGPKLESVMQCVRKLFVRET